MPPANNRATNRITMAGPTSKNAPANPARQPLPPGLLAGALDELRSAFLAEANAGALEQQVCLALAEREILGTELEQEPLRAKRRHWQPGRDAARDREHRALVLVVDQRSDQLERRA